jgi:hypothetical protein
MPSDFAVSALYQPSQLGVSLEPTSDFFSVDPGLPATSGAPPVRGLDEDGSLCRPMLILRGRQIGRDECRIDEPPRIAAIFSELRHLAVPQQPLERSRRPRWRAPKVQRRSLARCINCRAHCPVAVSGWSQDLRT